MSWGSGKDDAPGLNPRASAIGNAAPAAKVAELDFSKSRREIRKVPSNILSLQPAPSAGFVTSQLAQGVAGTLGRRRNPNGGIRGVQGIPCSAYNGCNRFATIGRRAGATPVPLLWAPKRRPVPPLFDRG